MVDVSIIIPVYNGGTWIDTCMESIKNQSAINSNLKLEIVVFNDGSNDGSSLLLEIWKEYFLSIGIQFTITGSPHSLGVGAAKNGAVLSSKGEYLCFQDIDDVMRPERIRLQYYAAVSNKNAIIGCKISRFPEGSTARFTKWANGLHPSLLSVQIYTSNGPTLLMPTWFCHRSVYDFVGGFDESGKGCPEDLIFFYKHLDLGGSLVRVEEELLLYTYHEGAATFSISREKIWQIQVKRIETVVLPQWESFSVWNAGRAGRKFVRALSKPSRNKVIAFCDIDKNKIGKNIELYCPKQRGNIATIPVIHFSKIKPPVVICVKLALTGGEFERNLESLNLVEGRDYILFS